MQSVVEHHQNALTSALPRRGRRRRSRKRKKEDEDETEKRTRKRRKKREMKVGDDRVDGEGTKQIEQCVSSAEFVRLKRPQI